MNKKTLFLLGSPFQCLCAFQAIRYYNIKNYTIFIPDTKGIENTEVLLQKKRESFTKINNNNMNGILSMLIKPHPKFETIFIGNYYDDSYLLIASLFSSRSSKICYLDDGTATMKLFSDTPLHFPTSISQKILKGVARMIFFAKRCSIYNYFTMFEVKSNKYNIVKFDFILDNNALPTKPQGVYVIGNNSSDMEFKTLTYDDYYLGLFEYLKLNYPNEIIYYCPHRRDHNNADHKQKYSGKGVEWFDTEISVEYDFTENNIYPVAIYGLNSTALFTLKKIYPLSEVSTVRFELKSNHLNEVEVNLLEDYKRANINIINVV